MGWGHWAEVHKDQVPGPALWTQQPEASLQAGGREAGKLSRGNKPGGLSMIYGLVRPGLVLADPGPGKREREIWKRGGSMAVAKGFVQQQVRIAVVLPC